MARNGLNTLKTRKIFTADIAPWLQYSIKLRKKKLISQFYSDVHQN